MVKRHHDIRQREASGHNRVFLKPTAQGEFAAGTTDLDDLVRRWMVDHAAATMAPRRGKGWFVDRLKAMRQG